MKSYACPRCSEEMKPVFLEGVEVEVCGSCSGVYLDQRELDAVTKKTEGSVEFCTATDDEFTTDDARDFIYCPKCPVEGFMRKRDFISLTEIVVDRCDTCGGVWLDAGELEKINEKIASLQGVDWQKSLSFWTRLQLVASRVAMSLPG